VIYEKRRSSQRKNTIWRAGVGAALMTPFLEVSDNELIAILLAGKCPQVKT
jgi:tRNA G18 (ribose-2'-O)-methylase SpoU